MKRDLSLLDAVGIGLGAVMGAGIFVVIGVAAGIAGPAMLVGLAMAGFAAACNGMSSAQLAAKFPQSGGTYEYGYRVVSPAAGFAAGWMFLASKLAAAGTVALGFGYYFSEIMPGVSAKGAAVAAVILVTAANLFGIKKAGRINLAIVALTLGVLGIFTAAGLPSFDVGNFRPFSPGGWPGVAESSAILFFAYTGYARIATLGEEVHEPEKTIPKAILATLGLSFLIYAAVAVIAIGSVGTEALAASRSPLERAAERFPITGVDRIVAVGAASAMIGVLLSQILGTSRMMLAMARRGDLPGWLGKIDERHAIPARGILLTGGIGLAACLFGTLETVIAAAAFTILIYYSITNLSAMRLETRDRMYPRWVAWAGLATCLAMAASLRREAVVTGLALLLTGYVFRWWLRMVAQTRG